MRFIDIFYAAAFIILLGWLALGSVIDVEHPGGSLVNENTASSPPADSASIGQPHPVATATVDERSFWIFVGGSPDVYGVAVGESPDVLGAAVGESLDAYGVSFGESTDVYGGAFGEAD